MLIDIQEAVKFIQWLEPQLAAKHIHCALTGSVLYKGASNNDLDVIIYPHNERAPMDPLACFNAVKLILPDLVDLDDLHSYPQARFVGRSLCYDWKIDFFFLKDCG